MNGRTGSRYDGNRRSWSGRRQRFARTLGAKPLGSVRLLCETQTTAVIPVVTTVTSDHQISVVLRQTNWTQPNLFTVVIKVVRSTRRG